MKQIIMKQTLRLTAFIALFFNYCFAIAQTSVYQQALPFQNYSYYGDTLIFVFTSTPVSPVINASIEIFQEGDYGDFVEFIKIYDENWNFIGNTNNNINGDCTYDSTVIQILNLAALNSYASNDSIVFYGIPTMDVDFFCVENRVKATLTYTYCNTPFSSYPSLSLSGSDNIFCPSEREINLTATPAGGTFTTTGGSINGNTLFIGNLTEGTYTITYTISQNGCTASDFDSFRILKALIPNVLDTTICPNESLSLSITNAPSSNYLNWYDNPSFTTPIATNTTSLNVPSITQNTSYYVRYDHPNYFEIISLNNSNHVVVDHEPLSGDDRGGIAVTSSHVYYVGDDFTVRYDLNLTPSSGISLPKRDGIFSDLNNGTLYTFHNGTDDINKDNYIWNNMDFVISEIRTMDANLNIAPTASITLSTPITIAAWSYMNSVYSGRGYVGIYNEDDAHFYVINLSNGQVTDLGEATEPNFMYGSENWAEWNILEYDGVDFYAIQRGYGANYNDLVRYKLPNTTTVHSVVQSFFSLGDAYNFTYWPGNDRLYVHIEYYDSDFGGGDENLAYITGTHVMHYPCDAVINVTVGCTGLDENSTASINLYPNPASNYIIIDLSDEAPIEIYSITGQLMQIISTPKQKHQVDISTYPAGLYFVKTGNQTLKFVKY